MLKIIDIQKNFDRQMILHGINLEIREGEFFALLGESGCGKTTLLRILAGLEMPSHGAIYLDDKRIDRLSPQKRPFNMVFQRYALFPHLNVFDNVAFGPRLLGGNVASLKSRVEETLRLVNLFEFKERFPETLSGGQQQRVALARAVVNHPRVLLLDEPLSALDKKMRENMREELKNLQRKVGITFIFVTHDQEEALALSHRVAVMNHGRLEQVSAPEELYHHPQTLFVSQFVGDSTTLVGPVIPPMVQQDERRAVLGIHLGEHCIYGLGKGQCMGEGVAVIRPEKIKLVQHASSLTPYDQTACNQIQGKVRSLTFKGSQSEVNVDIGNGRAIKLFVQDHKNTQPITIGDQVDINFAINDTYIFPAPSSPGTLA